MTTPGAGARRVAGSRWAWRMAGLASIPILGVLAMAAEPPNPGSAAACVEAPDTGTVADFDVYLDGKRSGAEHLTDVALPGGGRLVTLEYESSYLWTTFEHASRHVWRDGRLVCARGTGVNKGLGNPEPDAEIAVTRAKAGSTYDWRVAETGLYANQEPVRHFRAPLQAESFWLEPQPGDIAVVNLGRSAVYAATVERLADERVDGVRTRRYRMAGPKLAGTRANAEGLQRELWYDAIGLVRACGKETYRITVIVETVRTAPPVAAPPDAPPDEAAAPAKPCDEIFPQ